MPLCIAIALVVAIVLALECLRIINGYRMVKERQARLNQETVHTLFIKQAEKVVRVDYFSENDGFSVTQEAEEPEKPEESEAEPARSLQIAFSPREKLSFAEQMDGLSEDRKALFDEFVDYVCSKDACGSQMQTGALVLKYKKSAIVKAMIRREEVVLHFIVANSELGRMMREEKLRNLKIKPVEMRLKNQNDLQIAMQTADITVNYLRQEEEYRLQKRKEMRRTKRVQNDNGEVGES